MWHIHPVINWHLLDYPVRMRQLLLLWFFWVYGVWWLASITPPNPKESLKTFWIDVQGLKRGELLGHDGCCSHCTCSTNLSSKSQPCDTQCQTDFYPIKCGSIHSLSLTHSISFWKRLSLMQENVHILFLNFPSLLNYVRFIYKSVPGQQRAPFNCTNMSLITQFSLFNSTCSWAFMRCNRLHNWCP